jgi:hypothetical protein
MMTSPNLKDVIIKFNSTLAVGGKISFLWALDISYACYREEMEGVEWLT